MVCLVYSDVNNTFNNIKYLDNFQLRGAEIDGDRTYIGVVLGTLHGLLTGNLKMSSGDEVSLTKRLLKGEAPVDGFIQRHVDHLGGKYDTLESKG